MKPGKTHMRAPAAARDSRRLGDALALSDDCISPVSLHNLKKRVSVSAVGGKIHERRSNKTGRSQFACESWWPAMWRRKEQENGKKWL
jgi:hypothetical protein